MKEELRCYGGKHGTDLQPYKEYKYIIMQIICEYKVLKLRVQEVANNIKDLKTNYLYKIVKFRYSTNVCTWIDNETARERNNNTYSGALSPKYSVLLIYVYNWS